ncbi:MAG: Asp-tRNA(Asn)/Glu-tRNA(Gln) amidotransferase subunit GatB [Candidatus Nanoperiomorbaceae bacterium]
MTTLTKQNFTQDITVLGAAGEHGSRVVGDEFLVRGYLPTIGIETHVQLSTNTKLFSSSDNDARDAEPNSKISAIDYALPGMLPILNHEALRYAARAGKALNARIANVSRWDRKHYFYPDSPKGYQITQMYYPTIIGGQVELSNGAKVRIHHAHLEEDAGKLTHFADYSLVDLNRVGTPLIEIVSEPDMHSAVEAREYVEELHDLMTYAGVTNGDLYYGNMRFDVNISVARPGEKWGLRTEIKNLNSFRAVEKAADYEINRQIDEIENGETVVQETRGWNDAKQITAPQRSKEDAQDYRYMPDPDIPPVVLTDDEITKMQSDMPTLPPEFREKFSVLNMDSSVITTLIRTQKIAELVLEILNKSDTQTTRNVANLFSSSFAGTEENTAAAEQNLVLPSANNLIKLAQMFNDNTISSTTEKEIFAHLLDNIAADPAEYAQSHNLLQVSDEGAIAKIVDEVLASDTSAKAVADFKTGNEKVIGFLVGQVMKASKGQANPALAQKLIRQKLLS